MSDHGHYAPPPDEAPQDEPITPVDARPLLRAVGYAWLAAVFASFGTMPLLMVTIPHALFPGYGAPGGVLDALGVALAVGGVGVCGGRAARDLSWGAGAAAGAFAGLLAYASFGWVTPAAVMGESVSLALSTLHSTSYVGGLTVFRLVNAGMFADIACAATLIGGFSVAGGCGGLWVRPAADYDRRLLRILLPEAAAVFALVCLAVLAFAGVVGKVMVAMGRNGLPETRELTRSFLFAANEYSYAPIAWLLIVMAVGTAAFPRVKPHRPAWIRLIWPSVVLWPLGWLFICTTILVLIPAPAFLFVFLFLPLTTVFFAVGSHWLRPLRSVENAPALSVGELASGVLLSVGFVGGFASLAWGRHCYALVGIVSPNLPAILDRSLVHTVPPGPVQMQAMVDGNLLFIVRYLIFASLISAFLHFVFPGWATARAIRRR